MILNTPDELNKTFRKKLKVEFCLHSKLQVDTGYYAVKTSYL